MSELSYWRKKAEKALKEERENIYQEWIDWLYYDYNESNNPNLLSLIHFFERVGSKTYNEENKEEGGENNLVGLFGFTEDKEENKKRRLQEKKLIRGFINSIRITIYAYGLGSLEEGASKHLAVMLAAEELMKGTGKRLIDLHPFASGSSYYFGNSVKALNKQGFGMEYPADYADYLRKKGAEKSEKRRDKKRRKKKKEKSP